MTQSSAKNSHYLLSTYETLTAKMILGKTVSTTKIVFLHVFLILCMCTSTTAWHISILFTNLNLSNNAKSHNIDNCVTSQDTDNYEYYTTLKTDNYITPQSPDNYDKTLKMDNYVKPHITDTYVTPLNTHPIQILSVSDYFYYSRKHSTVSSDPRKNAPALGSAKVSRALGAETNVQNDSRNSQTNVRNLLRNTKANVHIYSRNTETKVYNDSWNTKRQEYNTEAIQTFYIDLNSCDSEFTTELSAPKGVVSVKSEEWNYKGVSIICTWKVTADFGYYITVYVEELVTTCWNYLYRVQVSSTAGFEGPVMNYDCNPRVFSVFVSDTHNVYFRLLDNKQPDDREKLYTPNFKVYFQTSKTDYRSEMSVVHTSPTTGLLTPWRFDDRDLHPCSMNVSYELSVPTDHEVMISFRYFYITHASPRSGITSCSSQRLQLYSLHEDGQKSLLIQACYAAVIPTQVYNSSLELRFLALLCNDQVGGKGFKMLYSFHFTLKLPPRYSNGKFNCSGSDYASFRQHLDCNLEPECHGGEDERADCPYSSPACHGAVATSTKCYRYYTADTAINWYQAQKECEKQGGNLAMMKTESEWQAVWKLFEHGKNLRAAWIGLYTGNAPTLNVYRFMFKWVDDSIALNINNTIDIMFTNSYADRMCGYVGIENTVFIDFNGCFQVHGQFNYVCETESSITSAVFITPPLFPAHKQNVRKDKNITLSLVSCPRGHVTRSFLSCDPQSHCDVNHPHCVSAAAGDVALTRDLFSHTFVCEDRKNVVAYTLLCDFRQDCPGGSDENFCRHRDQCLGFACTNGQCIEGDRRCDGDINCWDGSDEDCTPMEVKTLIIPRTIVYSPHVVINFDNTGLPSRTNIGADEPCPDTHFRCSDGYCLPVYMRCNGVLDCPGREDEADCQSFTCPGFYRCRASSVCVHAQHLCDGWPQCPQHDDELLCQAPCPQACSCQGLSFVCPRTFSADSFLNVRYLDASGSGMTAEELTQNVYLVWLSLASCRLSHLPRIDLPNLRNLDLSENKFTSINMNVFLTLHNLRTLRLSGNPLVSLVSRYTDVVHNNLTVVDLSLTLLRIFDSQPLSSYPHIKSLNISYSSLDTIGDAGLTYTRDIMEVDLRGSPVRQFPVRLMTDLSQLHVVYADNYRLCCDVTLPDHMDSSKCFAPADILSTCHDLLNSDVLRGLLWVMSTLALSGNSICLGYRLLIRKTVSLSAFNIFLTNLSLSNFMMGVYLAMVGGADLVYRGRYSSSHTKWTSSVTCTTAGFLSMLSNQVSAFVISLVTLDRFLATRHPASRVQFTRLSACVACGIAWTVGFVIAAVPLLPVTSEWRFYSQSGICIPLPITRKSFRGRDYAFAVMIVLNLVLFLLIAAGQALIYCSFHSFAFVTMETTRESLDLSLARRVANIALSDLVYWCFAGFVCIIDMAMGQVTNVIHLVMSVVLFPLNSALNPYLYLLGMLMEKRRADNRHKLMKRLARRIMSQKTDLDSVLSASNISVQ